MLEICICMKERMKIQTENCWVAHCNMQADMLPINTLDWEHKSLGCMNRRDVCQMIKWAHQVIQHCHYCLNASSVRRLRVPTCSARDRLAWHNQVATISSTVASPLQLPSKWLIQMIGLFFCNCHRRGHKAYDKQEKHWGRAFVVLIVNIDKCLPVIFCSPFPCSTNV